MKNKIRKREMDKWSKNTISLSNLAVTTMLVDVEFHVVYGIFT